MRDPAELTEETMTNHGPAPLHETRGTAGGLACAPRVLLLATALIAVACMNSRLGQQVSTSAQLATTPVTLTSPTPGDVYTISSIDTNVSAAGSQTGEIQLLIDASSPTSVSEPISQHCVPGTYDCVCQFNWVELNPNSQTVVQIPRSITTTVDLTQTYLVQCPEPSVWSTDIPQGTTVNITIAPSVAGSQNFSTNAYQYIMGVSGSGSSSGGYDFTDSTGMGFENVKHYTCFDNTTRGLGVASEVVNVSNDSSDSAADRSVYTALANATCSMNSDNTVGMESSSGTSSDCGSTQVNGGPTSQAAYYNLYNTEGGTYTVSNQRFYCPQVVESLNNSGSIGSQNQFWPLDTTFSLAQSPSPTYPVGVEAFTNLASTGSTGTSTSCVTSSSSGGTAPSSSTSGGSLAEGCLGYASLPNPDGSCPTITDGNGNVRAMYRLRRYSILYPQLFEANGTPIAGGTPADTIYVLDRPVANGPSSDPIVKPDTMLGPKPCPYAYYDRTGETSLQNPQVPQYTATNDPRWTGFDVDGNQFPNTDNGNLNSLSCSSVIAIPDESTQTLSIGTVNKANTVLSQIYVRPITAWTPHYEEDKSFLACTPQAWPVVRDPPLHFARTASGNISYCAEVYPSQNPNITALDPNNTGNVAPFTSHTSKNAFEAEGSSGSTNYFAMPACVATVKALTIPGSYTLGAQLARHPTTPIASSLESDLELDTTQLSTTCDRTVVASQASLSTTFPLLAPPTMVENALAADPGYECTFTHDNVTGTNSKVGVATPSQGCCGPAVRVYTGSPGPAGFNYNSAHLEPNSSVAAPTNCAEPNY